MINKQSLWFLTLFSIILVLSVYYIAMPNNTLATLSSLETSNETVSIEQTDSLTSLRIEREEELLTTMNELQSILLNESTTLEEKNSAYEDLQVLNSTKGKEEEIEKILNEEFKFQSFVKIEKDIISVTVSKKEHDNNLANKIIRKIQSLYSDKMYITVKFQ